MINPQIKTFKQNEKIKQIMIAINSINLKKNLKHCMNLNFNLYLFFQVHLLYSIIFIIYI